MKEDFLSTEQRRLNEFPFGPISSYTDTFACVKGTEGKRLREKYLVHGFLCCLDCLVLFRF